MHNTVVVVGAVVAVVIAVGATIAAVRAGRRAGRAAELVSQLLEPELVVTRAPADRGAGEGDGVAGADEAHETGAAGELGNAPDHREPVESLEVSTGAPSPDATGPARVPVLDLDRLRAWLTDADVRLGRVAVVSVEIDDLHDVTARLGERAGAELVDAIVQRLRALTRPRDVVAHVNQDRFVLVCRDVPDRSAAQALAERVALAVAHPSLAVAGVVEATASIGIALARDVDERPESVLRRAIAAGNRARQRGGARIEISDDEPAPAHRDVDFAAALTNEQFVLHYLPIVSCATGRIAGFETLVRWVHPDRGLLMPRDFLPQAERTGAIVPMGMWVIEQGCRQMATWHRSGAAATLKLDVNLSAREFAEPQLAAHVRSVIAEAGLPPGAVWLEITEETLLRDRDASRRTLARLHEIGVRLVIDDFGAGSSSLVSLKQFPLDAIKVDRAFVAELGASRDGDAICAAIVELAHSLALCVIAEGVETMEQFTTLRGLGCELAQGRLFGAARPAPDWGAIPASTTGVQPSSDAR